MQAALSSFLAAADLDELQAARQAIRTIDRQEAAALSGIVQAWSDTQAVANLLMYPEVMPAPHRLAALLHGLDETVNEYLVLAAVVGLQRIPDDDLPDEARPQIAARLAHLIRTRDDVIASRASVTISHYADDIDPEALLALIAHADDAVRHNLLVALLTLIDLKDIERLLETNVASGVLDQQAAARIREKFAQAGIDLQDAALNDEQLLGTALSLPVLTYIPNYDEWIGDGSPAGRPPTGGSAEPGPQ